jgi:LPS O-antigen subunit length determinant protein (WzzB/FepE family)
MILKKNNTKSTNEIDISELIQVLWDGKLKIFFITSIFLLLTFIYQSQIKQTYTSMTEVKPISIFTEIDYKTYNTYVENFFEGTTFNDEEILSGDNLSKLFIGKLNDGILFYNAIKKFNLVKKEDYDDKKSYEIGVKKLASSIKIKAPNNDEKKGKLYLNWRIVFNNVENIENWENLLSYVELSANKEIQSYLIKTFDKLIIHENNLKKFKIEDINLKQELAFTKYELEIQKKLAFLIEQAAIARELEVKRNTLESPQTFITEAGLVANVQTDMPYYMRGYEMIEKEIDLIRNRDTNAKYFATDLVELDVDKKTLLTNLNIERLNELFYETPIAKEDFIAGDIVVSSSKYTSNYKQKKLMLAMAGLMGAILAMIYVSFSQNRPHRK